MKHLLFCLLSFVLVLCSCKTLNTKHQTLNTIIRDSVSVTYRQGAVVSLAEPAELADPESAASPAQSSPKAQHDGLASQAQGCYSPQAPTKLAEYKRNTIAICELGDEEPRAIKLRVDTVVIERWHTREVPAQRAGAQCAMQSGRSRDRPFEQTSYIKHQTFYKNCTWGFWVLLLLLLGRIAVRIMKAIYLKR